MSLKGAHITDGPLYSAPFRDLTPPAIPPRRRNHTPAAPGVYTGPALKPQPDRTAPVPTAPVSAPIGPATPARARTRHENKGEAMRCRDAGGELVYRWVGTDPEAA